MDGYSEILKSMSNSSPECKKTYKKVTECDNHPLQFCGRKWYNNAD